MQCRTIMAVSKIPMPHEINGMNSEWCFVTQAMTVTSDASGWVYVSYNNTQLTVQNCNGLWVSPNNNDNSEYTCFDRVMHNSSGQWRVRCTDHNGSALTNTTRTIRIFAYVSRSIL